jgi:hypothetical protein
VYHLGLPEKSGQRNYQFVEKGSPSLKSLPCLTVKPLAPGRRRFMIGRSPFFCLYCSWKINWPEIFNLHSWPRIRFERLLKSMESEAFSWDSSRGILHHDRGGRDETGHVPPIYRILPSLQFEPQSPYWFLIVHPRDR